MQRVMRGFTPYPELLFCQLHKKVTKKSLHDCRLRPPRKVLKLSSIMNPASAHTNRGRPPHRLVQSQSMSKS